MPAASVDRRRANSIARSVSTPQVSSIANDIGGSTGQHDQRWRRLYRIVANDGVFHARRSFKRVQSRQFCQLTGLISFARSRWHDYRDAENGQRRDCAIFANQNFPKIFQEFYSKSLRFQDPGFFRVSIPLVFG